MTSTVYMDLKSLGMFSSMDSAMKIVKEFVKGLETGRELRDLLNLMQEEARLKECMDDIEDFHRDVFLLLEKEEKPDDDEKMTTMTDDTNQVEYSVTEPELMEHNPMNEPDFDEPGGSLNQRKSPPRTLLIKIKRNRINNENGSENESDYSYHVSSNNNDEAIVDIYESDDGNDKSNEDKEESMYGMDESVDCEDDVEDESSDDDKERAKKVVLDWLGNKEKEITELVLHLIKEFSCFQCRLRAAQKKSTAESNLGGSTLKAKLKSLNGSVMYLDKTVSDIYSKYSEMLVHLGNRFELNL